MTTSPRPVEVLVVEDNPGDVRLIAEAFKNGNGAHRLSVVRDGVEALAFLHRQSPYRDAPRPDLIVLDLNLPKKHGLDVLREIKGDAQLRCIPVVVLTTSAQEEDIRKSYELNANCYVTKRSGLDQFMATVRSIRDFWCTVVNLPPGD